MDSRQWPIAALIKYGLIAVSAQALALWLVFAMMSPAPGITGDACLLLSLDMGNHEIEMLLGPPSSDENRVLTGTFLHTRVKEWRGNGIEVVMYFDNSGKLASGFWLMMDGAGDDVRIVDGAHIQPSLPELHLRFIRWFTR